MSVSFVAVFVSQYYQQSLPSTVTCAQAGITSQDQVHDRESLFCFCGGLDAGKLLTEYSNYCSDFVLKFSIAKGLIFLTAASTVIVNALLQMFMDRLAKLERHGSVTSQQRGITSRLFWGLWFNTGVIILLVNADVKPYVGRALLPGDYSDFDVDWFNEVGVSVLVTYVHRSMRARMSLFCIVCPARCCDWMLIVSSLLTPFSLSSHPPFAFCHSMFLNSMNPHLRSLLAIPYDTCRRNKCAKYSKTQLELNQLYQGRRFELAERYSVLLVTVFVCMMFSAGLPLLWLVASFTFFTTYWFDKTTFLRSYRIPPRYDESLDEYAASVLPVAVVPHLLLAIWFFSAPMTNSMGLGSYVPVVGTDSSAVGPVRSGVFNLRQRILQWNTFPAALLLMVLFGVWSARKIISMVFFCCRASEAEQRDKALSKEEKRSRTRMVTYTEAVQKVGLESYRLSKQHEYRLAFLVTESKKQMPVELDLHQLRQWEQEQIRRKNAPPITEDEGALSSSSEESSSDEEGVVESAAQAKYSAATGPKLAKASAPKPKNKNNVGGAAAAGGPARAKAPKPKPKPTNAWGAAGSTGASDPTQQQMQEQPSGFHAHSEEPRPSVFAAAFSGSMVPSSSNAVLPLGDAVAAVEGTGSDAEGGDGDGGGGGGRPTLNRKLSLPTTNMHALPVAEILPPPSNGDAKLRNAFAAVVQAAVTQRYGTVTCICAKCCGRCHVPARIVSQCVCLVCHCSCMLFSHASALSAEQMGYSLLPIACPSCSHSFQIVDCGQAMSYSCPFCGAATIL
jgi:hypothetical protein